ncbi:hypothetical protein Abr02nite_03620 [Paractinoplanes brasiliensis]|nr:hypothetical protein Abr02nite_03620 [Actinoplanes brasiliensis]
MRDSCVTTVADDSGSCDRDSVRGSARIIRTVAPIRPNPKEGKAGIALTRGYVTGAECRGRPSAKCATFTVASAGFDPVIHHSSLCARLVRAHKWTEPAAWDPAAGSIIFPTY